MVFAQLLQGIVDGLGDVFFPDLNLMDRLSKYEKATSDVGNFICSLLDNYKTSDFDWRQV